VEGSGPARGGVEAPVAGPEPSARRGRWFEQVFDTHDGTPGHGQRVKRSGRSVPPGP